MNVPVWEPGMAGDLGSIDHLSQIISQVVAPSFVLGAVTGLISIIYSRMTALLDRIRSIKAITDDDKGRHHLRNDLPRLLRRTGLLQKAVMFAFASGISTTLLIIFAFAAALFRFQHVFGTAMLFIVSLAFFCASLASLALEGRISLSEFDTYH